MRRVATIGVYGFTLESFLDALRGGDVRTVFDVRQRRGVRGSEYAWANAVRLQAALQGAGIDYRHHKELAPTTELRRILQREDARMGVGQRSRTQLAPEFKARYSREILNRVDLRDVVESMPTRGATALFCVEGDPAACHRSLIAERMASDFGVSVRHLRR